MRATEAKRVGGSRKERWEMEETEMSKRRPDSAPGCTSLSGRTAVWQQPAVVTVHFLVTSEKAAVFSVLCLLRQRDVL